MTCTLPISCLSRVRYYLLRFKSVRIQNMDHMRIWGIEPSFVIFDATLYVFSKNQSHVLYCSIDFLDKEFKKIRLIMSLLQVYLRNECLFLVSWGMNRSKGQTIRVFRAPILSK